MSALTFQLPDEIRMQVEELARREGISIDDFLTNAAADKVSAIRSLDSLRQEAENSLEEDWNYVMSRVPDRPPLPGDELPEELKRALDQSPRRAL